MKVNHRLSLITDDNFKKAVRCCNSLKSLREYLAIPRCPRNELCIWERICLLGLNINHFIGKNRRYITLSEIEKGFQEIREKNYKLVKGLRANPKLRSKYMLLDYKKADKNYGFSDFDLTSEKIENLIKNGCFYCGEQELKMTLDRKINSKGHSLDNVNAACIRCNLFRRDIPYDIWLELIPLMRENRELGLLDAWREW